MVKSAMGFVKVIIGVLPPVDLAPHLKDLVSICNVIYCMTVFYTVCTCILRRIPIPGSKLVELE